MDDNGSLGLLAMARPVFHEELGKFFRDMRIAKEIGLRQAAQHAQARRLRLLTKQVLFSLENGRTKNIEPDVLKELAVFYGKPYEEIAAKVFEVRYGVSVGPTSDLLSHSRTRERTPQQPKGESDESASSRIRELEGRIAAYKFIIRRMASKAHSIELLAADSEKSGAVGRAAHRRRSGR